MKIFILITNMIKVNKENANLVNAETHMIHQKKKRKERKKNTGFNTVRGKKSRAPSPLAEATVERTLVSPILITTDPLANLAILPVSMEMMRDPTSKSSLKVPRTFRAWKDSAARSEGGGGRGGWETKAWRSLQRKRTPRRRQRCRQWKESSDAIRIRGLALLRRVAATAANSITRCKEETGRVKGLSRA